MRGYAGSSPESSLFAYVLSEKSLATPDCFAPYLENVATKAYFYKCLETGFIFEEFCVITESSPYKSNPRFAPKI